MDKQKANELKGYIGRLVADNPVLIKHAIVHMLLGEIESYHKQLHREEKGCAFENK